MNRIVWQQRVARSTAVPNDWAHWTIGLRTIVSTARWTVVRPASNRAKRPCWIRGHRASTVAKCPTAEPAASQALIHTRRPARLRRARCQVAAHTSMDRRNFRPNIIWARPNWPWNRWVDRNWPEPHDVYSMKYQCWANRRPACQTQTRIVRSHFRSPHPMRATSPIRKYSCKIRQCEV